MYIRAQSPESSNCCGSLAPLAPLISSSHSSRADDGGGGKSPASPFYSLSVSSVSRATAAAADHHGASIIPAKNANNNNGSKSKSKGSISFSIDDNYNYNYDDEYVTRRREDVLAPPPRVESEYFRPRVENKCLSTRDFSSDSIYDHAVVENEDRIVNFVSPCKSSLDVEGCAELAQTCSSSLHQQQQTQTTTTTTEDSSSVLQQKWSTWSSTDSLKSINQDDDSEERRNSDQFSLKSALNEDALFYRSYGALRHQQQQPGSSTSIGLHRKWSDSSCSLDSIDQEDEDKTAPAFLGSHHMSKSNIDTHTHNHHHSSNGIHSNETIRFKGLSGMLHKKWSASNCSLDSIDNEDEEDNYEIVSRFPPLIESVRLKDPTPMFHCRNDKEGPIMSSSSSSIGNRSEDSSGSVVSDVDSPGDMEVESSLRGGSHSQLNLSSLESSLPIKRGLSRFWNGKAKSFAFLQDVSSLATLADLAKPENPYNKRRRFSSGFGMRPSSPLSRPNTAGISKKPPSGTGKSCLAIAVAMGSKVENGPKCLSPQSALRNAQRSFSLSDLDHHGINPDAAPAAANTMTRMRR
ncbi:hypothetical protein Mapa_000137 [Marchantia paleacea]|nr:hypothetical protein Mapa_000137 [Marchantia paleacea]